MVSLPQHHPSGAGRAKSGDDAGTASRSRALSRTEISGGLRRTQAFVGMALLASALSGSYMLATDGSLWQLAVSHAAGLVIVVAIDLVLGALSLVAVRRVYVASLAAAVLGIALQLGDLSTASQYGMTVSYFASYLFGLWSFDLLLGLQVAALAVGLLGKEYAAQFARRKAAQRRELGYSRRGFIRTIAVFAAAVGAGVAIGSVKLPTQPSLPPASTQRSGPPGSVANVNNLLPNSPVTFEYPPGYPNLLMKKTDGSVSAVSLLCTHVCCECTYDSSNKVIFCGCHGSVFDMVGKVMRGPARTDLPSITLTVDSSGNIFPTGVNGSSPCLQA